MNPLLSIIARDSEGRISRAPLSIRIGNQLPADCPIFSEDAKTFPHVYRGSLERLREHNFLQPRTVPQTTPVISEASTLRSVEVTTARALLTIQAVHGPGATLSSVEPRTTEPGRVVTLESDNVTEASTVATTVAVNASASKPQVDTAGLLISFPTETPAPTAANNDRTTTTTTAAGSHRAVTPTESSMSSEASPATLLLTTPVMTPHPTPQELRTTTPRPIARPDQTLVSIAVTTTTAEPHVTLAEGTTLAAVPAARTIGGATVGKTTLSPSRTLAPAASPGVTPAVTTVAPVTMTYQPVFSGRGQGRTTHSWSSVGATNEPVMVNLITFATPPTTSALPVATRMSLYSTASVRVSGNDKPGAAPNYVQVPASGAGHEQTSAAMVDMACRMRSQKPIFSVICDMAKTVYKTAL